MMQVSGRKMVTPEANQAICVSRRRVASRCIISAMVFAPSTSSALAYGKADDALTGLHQKTGDLVR